MADPARFELPPARPPTPKPTSVRDLTGEPAAPQVPPDSVETEVEVGGEVWTVRVMGRSGRASGASPPLLLLGFWQPESSGDTPTREALVVGRTLDGLSLETLVEACAAAGPPHDPDRRPGFFQEGAPGRRSRPNENI